MTEESRHLSIRIARPIDEVYDYASDPANLSAWAAGLGSSATLVDGRWVMDSPAGHVVIAFAPRNEFGVLDHHVTPPLGETIYVPARVIAAGSGSELMFTLRREPGMSEADFDRDAAAVSADLATIKRLLEDPH